MERAEGATRDAGAAAAVATAGGTGRRVHSPPLRRQRLTEAIVLEYEDHTSASLFERDDGTVERKSNGMVSGFLRSLLRAIDAGKSETFVHTNGCSAAFVTRSAADIIKAAKGRAVRDSIDIVTKLEHRGLGHATACMVHALKSIVPVLGSGMRPGTTFASGKVVSRIVNKLVSRCCAKLGLDHSISAAAQQGDVCFYEIS